MITLLLFLITAIYAGQMLWLRAGLKRFDNLKPLIDYEPSVSVIVAARNEERYIIDCLQSLVGLEYPKSKLEIIIVNDGSEDGTAAVVEAFAGNHDGIKLLTTKAGKANLRGKTNAVAQGIDASHGEILMFTDADCAVPSEWIRQTVSSFGDRVGVVGGFTLLGNRTVFELIQALDWIFLFGLSSAMAGWGMPLTVIGNNLSVRRTAYTSTGGFAQIPFSVTEDYALVQAIVVKKDYDVVFPVNTGTLVRSRACRTIRQLYRQKQRWGVGGLDMVFRGLAIMLMSWLIRFLPILAALAPIGPPLIVAVITMLIVDLAFLWKPLKAFNRLRDLRYFLVFELYLSFYVLAIPFVAVLNKHVVWKERKL